MLYSFLAAFDHAIRDSWTVTSSGVYPDSPGVYRAKYGIDGVTGDLLLCFSSPLRRYNWFQVSVKFQLIDEKDNYYTAII